MKPFLLIAKGCREEEQTPAGILVLQLTSASAGILYIYFVFGSIVCLALLDCKLYEKGDLTLVITVFPNLTRVRGM